jgi:hypothetical protein
MTRYYYNKVEYYSRNNRKVQEYFLSIISQVKKVLSGNENFFHLAHFIITESENAFHLVYSIIYKTLHFRHSVTDVFVFILFVKECDEMKLFFSICSFPLINFSQLFYLFFPFFTYVYLIMIKKQR